ncbi:formimidoylglutamase [Fictibacillus sp. 5RED26]|jgi:formiminoglutamase|uniref:formimidoylglutamase n=1 Tax=Fictibacillus sp. 5RED26 TaxID=2745876 RepID=UPI0018CD7E27|nr:formimidoylglutamase [Fictibacillus sp. 5RED26]MBH0154951.1 formimidoylglutamase [Fictibacillus sp. 5RED26]
MQTIPFLRKSDEAPFTDRGIKKAGQLLKPWSGEEVRGVAIAGAPLSKTSISHSGAHLTPQTIRAMMHSFSTYSIEEESDLWDQSITDFGDIEMHVTDLFTSQSRIHSVLKDIGAQHRDACVITLGGDHSVSAGAIKAFQETRGRVGIIQFDAHFDLRNTEDGGPSNGTPFRQLIENGVITGDQLVQIGIRDFSNGKLYHDYAKDHGVTVHTMGDVKRSGLLSLLQKSVDQLKQTTDNIYISLDMDVLDQAFAPGCPAIGPGGLDSDSLIEGIQYLAQEPSVKGMDIVEIDPTLDFRNMTSRLAAYIIIQFTLFYTKRKGGIKDE